MLTYFILISTFTYNVWFYNEQRLKNCRKLHTWSEKLKIAVHCRWLKDIPSTPKLLVSLPPISPHKPYHKPPHWPRARRNGKLHRVEHSRRDFALSDKGWVFLVGRERREWKGDWEREKSGNLLPPEHLCCIYYHTSPSQTHLCARACPHTLNSCRFHRYPNCICVA